MSTPKKRAALRREIREQWERLAGEIYLLRGRVRHAALVGALTRDERDLADFDLDEVARALLSYLPPARKPRRRLARLCSDGD